MNKQVDGIDLLRHLETNMKRLTTDDLYSLGEYSQIRPDFRTRVMARKRKRYVPIGTHVTLHFENRLTIHYQVQEMLHAERIFEADGIQSELDAYNALIPDGSNWKATMMIEYEDVNERRDGLARLRGIEDRAWVQVADHEKVWAVADEDLERENASKTSAVHFLRFELSTEMADAAKNGASVTVGIDHPDYSYRTDLPTEKRKTLAADLH
jgi:hypothetical protein